MYYQEDIERKERRRIIVVATIAVAIILALIVAIIVAIFWNYQMQRMFVFKSKQIDELACEQEEIENN